MNSISAAGILGFLGVALGAFGAHALKERLGTYLPTWNTAVLYHLVHAVAFLALALYGRIAQVDLRIPLICFAAGIALFSGSLYALSLTGIKPLGAITPLGGLCFLAGWAALIFKFPR
jgi:uncharacterized membrane protein YgdD (TMEM256/DUF423 family)